MIHFLDIGLRRILYLKTLRVMISVSFQAES
jgi:hypothetical protein